MYELQEFASGKRSPSDAGECTVSLLHQHPACTSGLLGDDAALWFLVALEAVHVTKSAQEKNVTELEPHRPPPR